MKVEIDVHKLRLIVFELKRIDEEIDKKAWETARKRIRKLIAFIGAVE